MENFIAQIFLVQQRLSNAIKTTLDYIGLNFKVYNLLFILKLMCNSLNV